MTNKGNRKALTFAQKIAALNGKPTIRGMRFPVSDILEMLSSGMPHADILEQHPILQEENIQAALYYFNLTLIL